jgi:HAD superfamily hydrolase (TIGR01490 family)
MRDSVGRVDRNRQRVEFVKRYSDLYGAYTETEVLYTDEHTLALWESLGAGDQARFPFDAAMVDWKYYLKDVHNPAITQSLREMSRRDRERPTVTVKPSEHRVCAVFDMEGTIISSNVVESYVWTRLADLDAERWPAELVDVFRKVPGYLQVDRRDRGDFLRTFFRRYEGASVEGIERLVDEHVGEFMLQKASAAAIRRIREHRSAGHTTVLLTAAATQFLRPLAPLFDVVVGAELEVRDGRFTGFMSAPPLVGEARAAWLRRWASTEGVELRRSFAYADSYSDLPLLRAVGNPVAVSPDASLYRYARRRRWPIEEWGMTTSMPRVRFPRPAGSRR